MAERTPRLIDVIAGARPNFMKIAPIIRAIESRQRSGSALAYRLVHTGQHYDERMSGDFFRQLGIPFPDVNLAVGSGTQAEQTANIMVKYEQTIFERQPDVCLVVGDVTSTMACAIAAQKLRVRVAHVEAGIRSGDWRMPEEINRLVTDSITDWFFTTSDHANNNLRAAGVSDDRIFFVGNTMIDTLLVNLDRLERPAFFHEEGLEERGYFVMTLHRPGNVDSKTNLQDVITAVADASRGLAVVFPVHPRTEKTLQQLPSLPAAIKLVPPQSYLEFNWLVKNAKAVVTDSGGITEETTVLNVPCMTLRDNTERPETVEVGTNELLGTNPAAIGPAFTKVFSGQWKKGSVPEKWDGKTGERIADHLERLLHP